jgi:hypothetical protein
MSIQLRETDRMRKEDEQTAKRDRQDEKGR